MGNAMSAVAALFLTSYRYNYSFTVAGLCVGFFVKPEPLSKAGALEPPAQHEWSPYNLFPCVFEYLGSLPFLGGFTAVTIKFACVNLLENDSKYWYCHAGRIIFVSRLQRGDDVVILAHVSARLLDPPLP